MSRLRDRDLLVASLTRTLPDVPPHQIGALARALLRAGATLQRLAEAQCNGDWPYDQGNYRTEGRPDQYAPCARCEQDTRTVALKYAPTSLIEGTGERTARERWCPDCRAQERVRALLQPYGLVPRFDGDPRGPVLRVFPAGIDWQTVENGSERGVFVS